MKNKIKTIFCMIMALMLLLTMFPYADPVHAEEAGDVLQEETPVPIQEAEGDLLSEAAEDTQPEEQTEDGERLGLNKETVTNALTGAQYSYVAGTHTHTYRLTENVALLEPLVLHSDTAGETVVVDLNGYTITGAAGVSGAYEDSEAGRENARGKAAILIEAAKFNVTIKGPGTIVGGKGAVFQNSDTGYRFGCRGGNAILLTCGDDTYYPENELEYALTVTGGAQILGGDGGDVTYEDWEQNLRVNGEGMSSADAGDGGCGITQVCNGSYTPEYRSQNAYREKVFLKYLIENAEVSGGKGGCFLGGDHSFSHYALRNNALIKEYLQNGEHPLSNIGAGLGAGNGGSGIEYYWGRKYIYIGEDSHISGGTGGQVILSDTAALTNKAGISNGEGGAGIMACGDIGLTNTAPTLSLLSESDAYWTKKDKDSPDIGLWIDGTVTGGNTADAFTRQQSSEYAGHAILMDGDAWHTEYDYYGCYNGVWGIIAVGETGTVAGGNAGNAVWGDGGPGGSGFFENRDDNGRYAQCDCFIIRGKVSGGNGGNSLCGSNNSGSQYGFSTSLAEIGQPGSGGHGFRYDQYKRAGVTIAGDGEISAGTGGHTSRRGGENAPAFYDTYYEPWYTGSAVEEAVNYLSETGSFCDPALTLHDEKSLYIDEMDATGLSATASMDPFSWFWNDEKKSGDVTLSDDTRIWVETTLPDGYEGKVYYDWRAVFSDTRTGEVTNFTVGYGRYETDLGSSRAFTFGEAELPLDDFIKFASLLGNNGNAKTTFYCYIMLEDGRYVKSSPVIFYNNGRGYGNGDNPGPGPGPGPIIDPLPVEDDEDVTGVTLNTDALTLYPGDTSRLYAIINPAGAADKTLWWECSDEDGEFVTVDDGLVTAIKAGTDPEDPGKQTPVSVTVIAYANGAAEGEEVSDQCIVTVLPSEVTDKDEEGQPIEPGPELTTDNETGLARIWVSGLKEEYYYTGNAVKPEIHVYNGHRLLEAGKDYTVRYQNNTKIADKDTLNNKGVKTGPQIILEMKGSCAGKKTLYFSIVPMPLEKLSANDATLTAAYKNNTKNKLKPVLTYEGTKITYKPADLTFKWFETDENGDATEQESDCINEGTYAVKVYAGNSGNFTDATATGRQIATISVHVQPLMSNVKISWFKKSLPYKNGEAVRQDALVLSLKDKNGTNTYTENTSEDPENPNGDYTVTYENNHDLGTATMTLEAVKDSDGKYTGRLRGKIIKTFTITGKYTLTTGEGGNCTVDLSSETFKFTNAAITPAVTVRASLADPDGTVRIRTLKQGKDYTVSYKNNKAVASADERNKNGKDIAPQVIIKGKGSYVFADTPDLKQGIVKRFAITKTALKDLVLTISDVPYNRQANKYLNAKILFTDKNYRDLKLKKDKDYTVTYTTSDGTDAPKAGQRVSVKITATEAGSYTGSVTGSYRITDPSLHTDISKANVVINPDTKGKTQACLYTGRGIEPGNENEPELKLTIGRGSNLRELEPAAYGAGDYEIIGYFNNVNPGNSAIILIRGIGDFRGVRAVKFKITTRKEASWWGGIFGRNE